MEISKKYKLVLKDKSIFTATIKDINDHFVVFIDKNNVERGVILSDIKSYREITY